MFGVSPRVYADGKLICEVGNAEKYRVAFDEWQANAHLIAAAPDLFAALVDLIDDLEVRSTNGVVNCSHGIYCAARQAIAKATTLPKGA